MGAAPVFIGGAGRSGTTLIVDMLGLHPRISPIYETDFVIPLIGLLSRKDVSSTEAAAQIIELMDRWTKPLPLRPHNKHEQERYHHGPHYVLFDRPFAMERTLELATAVRMGEREAGLRGFMTSLFAEHCRRDGKPRWVNKTPAYIHHLPVLLRLFPEMRFIHCVRDGRDVACSVLNRPWGPKTTREAAVWWSEKVKDAMKFQQEHPERCFAVRYEDMLREPEKTLDSVLGWLGEEGDAAKVLEHYGKSDVPLDPARMERWRTTFSEEDHRAFNQLAGSTLADLGYDA